MLTVMTVARAKGVITDQTPGQTKLYCHDNHIRIAIIPIAFNAIAFNAIAIIAINTSGQTACQTQPLHQRGLCHE